MNDGWGLLPKGGMASAWTRVEVLTRSFASESKTGPLSSHKSTGSKKFLQKILETEDGLLYDIWYMAWTPPFNRREKGNLLNDARFYRLLVENCKYLDKDTALIFYATVVQIVGQELRRNKVVSLPHLGDFALVEQKPRPAWAGRKRVFMPARDVLKFYPKEKLRRYFNKRQGIIVG